MKLFEPGKIGNLTIKNRIVMAAMGTGGLIDPFGRLSKRGMDYYEARAKGGVGLIVTGMTRVSRFEEQMPDSNVFPRPLVDGKVATNWLNELAERMHIHGAKLAVQLTAGWGRVVYHDLVNIDRAIAPSEVPCFRNEKINAREISIKEIQHLLDCFAFSSEIAKKAGVDAIELHGHEGYLLDQFKTAIWNKRKDQYGGSLENRLRFPMEVIKAIKKGGGSDFPVIYKIGLTHYLKGGRELDEGLKIIKILESAGVDAFVIDAGCYEKWQWAHPPTSQPPGCMVDMAIAAKEVVSVPVVAVGKLGYPELAEEVLKSENADFIAIGRPLLADPEWPNKVQRGETDDIVPCLGDHEFCLNRIVEGKYISCSVNPETGMEKEFSIEPAKKPKKLLVVGGGPAGMEAAIVAAKRGHDVALWEKSDQLGGMLIPGSIPEFKRDYKLLRDYLVRQVEKLDISVKLKAEATLEHIENVDSEAVFIATGANHILPKIPGVDRSSVVNAIDVLSGTSQVGEAVAIIGGGLVGCETALYLAQNGKTVTVIEAMDSIASNIEAANRLHMLELLAEADVAFLLNTRILEINDVGVRIHTETGETRQIACNNTIVAVGLKPRNTLFKSLSAKRPGVHAIGDCIEPRRVANAIWEGFHAARIL
ncbi:MAG: FAD-dependent oxidoreductase [Desulfobacteraceae bacterium]|nr:FAD-dependent oxidoreductase [Desulfobacteraceae bacterium]